MAHDNRQQSPNTDNPAAPPDPDRQDRLEQLSQRGSKPSAADAVLLRDVFGDIFAAYHDQVWDHLRRRSLSTNDAEDLLQETFLGLFNYIQEKGSPDSLLGMLLDIANKKLCNHFRGTKRSPFSLSPLSSSSEVPRSGFDIDRALDLHELALYLIPKLTTAHREVFETVALNGFSYSEAADILGIPKETVKSRLMAAKRALLVLAEPFVSPSQRGNT